MMGKNDGRAYSANDPAKAIESAFREYAAISRRELRENYKRVKKEAIKQLGSYWNQINNEDIQEMISVNTSNRDLLEEINTADNVISRAGDILLFKAESGDLPKRELKLFFDLMESIEKEVKELRSRMKKIT